MNSTNKFFYQNQPKIFSYNFLNENYNSKSNNNLSFPLQIRNKNYLSERNFQNNFKNQDNYLNDKIHSLNENIIENDEEYHVIRNNIKILQQKINNLGYLNDNNKLNHPNIQYNNFMNENINVFKNKNNSDQYYINQNQEIKKDNIENYFYNPIIRNSKIGNQNINLKDSINDSSINESINLSILAEEIVKAFELDNNKTLNNKNVSDKRVDFIQIQKQLNQIKQNIENFQIKDINDKTNNAKINLKSNYNNSIFKNDKKINDNNNINYQNNENFLISNNSNNNNINNRYDDKEQNNEYKKVINNQITTIREINEDDDNGIEENYFIDNDLTNYNDSQRYEKYNPIHSIILEVSENKECSEILPKDELKNSISFLKESNCNLNKNITQGRISEYTENQENNNSLDNLKLSIIKSNELNSSQKLKSSFLRENNKINESKNFIDDDSDEETDMILNQIIQTAKNQELMEKEEKKNS
jgi:hypothetical protein